MSFVSPIVATDSERLAAPRERARSLHIAFAILTLVTIARLGGTVDSDVAWQLWIAQRMQAGANLYRDIVETNPPLWFWMARPVERLSLFLQLRIESVLIVTIAAAVALAITATNRLLHGISDRARMMLLSYAALVLFAMPWLHVGQREQIVLIVTLPYAALVSARSEGRTTPAFFAALVGAAAGLGFALKHYFLIVPLLLEVWLAAKARRIWRPFRAETLAMAAVGALYAAAMLAEQDYLHLIVPLVRQAYDSFSAPALSYLLGPPALVALAILTILGAQLKALKQSSLASALTVAALGYGSAYVIQFKGWPYHAIPMLGCASLSLATLLLGSGKKSRVLRFAGPALLCLPFSVAVQEAVHGADLDPDLERAVAGLPPGTPVAFISENSALAWSVTLQRQLAYPQRYNGYWMLGALVRDERARGHDAGILAAWRTAVANTVTDLRCLPPRRIIIARPKAGSWNASATDPLPYFTRDPEFARLLTYYRATSRTTVEVYDQLTPLPKAPAADCSPR